MKSLLISILTILSICFAQVSQGGSPRIFSMSVPPQIEMVDLPTIDHQSFLTRDANSVSKDEPYSFGESQSVNFNMADHGEWTETVDGKIWKLTLRSMGAYSLNLIYNIYNIPPGAELYLFDENRSTILGAFTDFNHKPHGGFSTAPTAGDVVTLEYFQPHNVIFDGEISISNVIHAYRDVFFNERGYGDSGSCNNNVSCSEFSDWEAESRSVAMILSSGGSRLCTGALVNNIRQDLTPYFLTANHCLGGESNWIFMFNYESPVCNNQNGPTNMTLSGATLLDNSSSSDFAILLISEEPPLDYGVHYSGWDANGSTPSTPVGIHHPSGDIKKISFDYDNASNSGNYWDIDSWDDGTTEPGSSGSPLFDGSTHRIIGQLYGGVASCTNFGYDTYGKVSTSWGLGLNSILDPDNTGQTGINGIDQIDLPDPMLAVSVSEFYLELSAEESLIESFTISNIGEADSELNYSLATSPYQSIGAGPDGGDYFWTSSTINANTNFEWIDISQVGTVYTFADNDNAGDWVDLDFSFSFYGSSYNQFFVNPNGWIGFETDNDTWENTSIPSNAISGAAIFALWDDLNPTNESCNEYCGGQVYTHSNAERTVIWFNDVAHWWTSFENTTYDFQVVLYATGEMNINYNTLNGAYTASVGIQSNSIVGTLFTFDNETLENNFTLGFNTGPNWLSLNNTTGTVQEGAATNVNFT
ncbi:MAG: trypsin-like peptidase domain-containing protein, partial [Candidatus Marinimicrobia bacterium]|nr:trypsin-like peptidase domain-containing protein [Candidatus Neomarinimicrobiota bacterium]